MRWGLWVSLRDTAPCRCSRLLTSFRGNFYNPLNWCSIQLALGWWSFCEVCCVNSRLLFFLAFAAATAATALWCPACLTRYLSPQMECVQYLVYYFGWNSLELVYLLLLLFLLLLIWRLRPSLCLLLALSYRGLAYFLCFTSPFTLWAPLLWNSLLLLVHLRSE